MSSVGRELLVPQEGGFQPSEGRVQDACKTADLVIQVSDVDSLGQVSMGDTVRSPADLFDGTNGTADE
jgi:hypothetical protein